MGLSWREYLAANFFDQLTEMGNHGVNLSLGSSISGPVIGVVKILISK
jgi:hypothetical protein